ncbi:hypothetical protein JXL19_10530 [bacterium]|nr:hypothetical protein [bacterium]
MLGKRLLKPDEDTMLRIVYQTRDRPGPYEKRIYISTDIPGLDDVVITIKGTVLAASVAKIRVEPRKFKLGDIRKGSVTDLNLRMMNQGSETLVITKIQDTETGEIYFDGTKEGNLIIGPKGSSEFKVPFVTDSPVPFIRVIFIESNARNAPDGRYGIMVIGRTEQD